MTDCALLMAVRSFAARGEHRVDGHVNVAAYLQHVCHLKKRQALRLARLSRFLDHQPVLEAAMADGRIGVDHLELFADLHRERFARPGPRRIRCWWTTRPWPGSMTSPVRPNASPTTSVPKTPMTGSPNRSRAAPSPRPPPSTASATSKASSTPSPTPSSPPNTTASSAIEYQNDLAIAREVLGRDPDPLELAQITRTPTQRSADARPGHGPTLHDPRRRRRGRRRRDRDPHDPGPVRSRRRPRPRRPRPPSGIPTGSASSTTAPSSPPSPPSTSPRSPTSGASSTAPTTRSSPTAEPAAATAHPNTGPCAPSTGAARTPGAAGAPDGSSKPTTSSNTKTADPPTAATASASAASTTAGRPRHKHDPPRTTRTDTGARRARPPDLC